MLELGKLRIAFLCDGANKQTQTFQTHLFENKFGNCLLVTQQSDMYENTFLRVNLTEYSKATMFENEMVLK